MNPTPQSSEGPQPPPIPAILRDRPLRTAHISKSDSFERKFELACFRANGYTHGYERTGGIGAARWSFQTFGFIRPVEGMVRRAELSIARPAAKHSVVAVAFLMLYVAIYLAIGFLGISLIGRAWATVFE